MRILYLLEDLGNYFFVNPVALDTIMFQIHAPSVHVHIMKITY